MKRPGSKPATLLALSAALAASGAQASVFQINDLASGYKVAIAEDAGAQGSKKGGEARCGADCATNMKGVSEAEAKAACAKAHAEGKCGTHDRRKEGKSGEAKCGGKK